MGCLGSKPSRLDASADQGQACSRGQPGPAEARSDQDLRPSKAEPSAPQEIAEVKRETTPEPITPVEASSTPQAEATPTEASTGLSEPVSAPMPSLPSGRPAFAARSVIGQVCSLGVAPTAGAMCPCNLPTFDMGTCSGHSQGLLPARPTCIIVPMCAAYVYGGHILRTVVALFA
jgi:hypothetical protein